MSNPSLPPLAPSGWPMPALDEIARGAAAVLDASRVWIALSDPQSASAPRVLVAVAADEGPITSIDPRTRPDLVMQMIKQVTNDETSTETQAITDVHAHPEFVRRAGADAQVIRALAATPLVNEAQVIGALVVARARPEPVTHGQRRLLQVFANQVVNAVRLAIVADRNAAQARELNALLSASQALTSTLNSDEVFRAIIQSIQRVISCESALIFRFDERAGELRVITVMGQGTEHLMGSVISLNDAGSNAALAARSLRSSSGWVGPEDKIGALTDVLRAGTTVALLCMPLLSKGRLRGVASLARQQAFTTREVSAMERLSPIAAAALENVELFQRELSARQQQEALFASASDGFAVVDDALRFVQVNDAFARYVAADANDLVGQLCCLTFGATLEPTPSVATCQICKGSGECLMREAIERRQGRDHVECVFPAPMRPSGPHLSIGPVLMGRAIDFSLTPMQGPEGRAHLLLVGRDVSGPREVELVRAQYIHMTSHEVAAPLQTITGHLEAVLKGAEKSLGPERIALLHTALATTYSMRTLADDLEVLSQQYAGKWEVSPRAIDLSAEAHAAAVEMNLIAREKGVTLLVQPSQPGLPPALMDPRRARQVARNLIINAIKYTPPGGWVRVSVGASAEQVMLRVADSGIGIPKDEQSRIWKSGHRVERPESVGQAPGQGFGLAIVRLIVTEHGGTYHVESEPGHGSVFTIGIPRADRQPRR